MALRLRPVDTTFYDLFTQQAGHLVVGADLLGEMLQIGDNREDIYSLASLLDDVMDFMEEAVDLVLLYEVDTLPGELAEQVDVLQRCARLTADSMPRLQTMKDLEEYWIEINRLENAGDKSYRRILAKLFGGGYEALEVLKLKDIVDSLEGAIDACESVANIVEQIAVKES